MRALVLLALLIAPLAAAHGASAPYDPLVVELHAFLAADGTISEGAQSAGAIAFPASTPAAPGAPLRFSLMAPVRFAPAAGFAVALSLRADAPVATGDGLEISIEPGGEPQRIPLTPVLAPGDLASIGTVLGGAGEYAEGDRITLVVRALAPALAENALFLVVGPEASRFDALDMRVPGVADLGLQESDVVEFLAEDTEFVPSRPSTVHRFTVGHDSVGAPITTAGDTNSTFVVLVGSELAESASTHSFPDRARRIAAAHAFTVNGALVRVQPGVGVAIPVSQFPVRIRCVANCPPGGFSSNVADALTPPTDERPSALVPPPRETRDIPVSQDEPAAKQTPGLAPGTLVIATLMLALASRRSR